MKNAQPTAAQAAAFIRAAYELKEKLSDQVEMSIEVGRWAYRMVIFRLNINEWECVGIPRAYYDLLEEKDALTDEQNAQAISHCVTQAREIITSIGGFATK